MSISAEPVGIPHYGRRPLGRSAPTTDSLYRLRPKEIWNFLKKQQLSFWLLCLYMMWEYVRPQDIYPSLTDKGLPFWTIILCAVVYLFEGNRPREWTLGDTLLTVFSLIVLASTATAYLPSRSIDQYSIFFGWVLVYVLVTGIVNNEARFYVFMLFYLVYCMKMTQHGVRSWASSGFSFITIGVSCAPTWFRNSGECGVQMAMLFPVSMFFVLALRVYWDKLKLGVMSLMLPAGSVITMVASSSRGALVGLAAVAVWLLLKSKRRFKALVGIALLAATVWTILPQEQKQRFDEAGEDGTSIARKTYWLHGLEIMDEYPVLGIGYKNWLPYYRQYYNPDGEVPHNVFIEAGAELGYTGLFGFSALIIGTFVINHRTRKTAKKLPDPGGRFFGAMAHGFDCALIGFVASGFFVTVLYYPFFWVNFSMTVSLYLVARRRAREVSAASRMEVIPRRGVVTQPQPTYVAP